MNTSSPPDLLVQDPAVWVGLVRSDRSKEDMIGRIMVDPSKPVDPIRLAHITVHVCDLVSYQTITPQWVHISPFELNVESLCLALCYQKGTNHVGPIESVQTYMPPSMTIVAKTVVNNGTIVGCGGETNEDNTPRRSRSI